MIYKVQFSAAVKKITQFHSKRDAFKKAVRKENVSLSSWRVVSERKCAFKENIITYPLFTFYSICLTVLGLQMAAKMGGDQMPNMNSSPPVIDPSLYGFGGQKRSLDNGGKPSHTCLSRVHVGWMSWYIYILATTLSNALAFILSNINVDIFKKENTMLLYESSQCLSSLCRKVTVF